jgi:putative cardiolipin synthase
MDVRSAAWYAARVVMPLLAMVGCASLPTGYERVDSYVIEDTQDTRLGKELAPLLAAHPGQAGFVPLVSGTDALVARVALMRAAERSLDIQYYIWHADTAGRILSEELLHAADRGVRVRLLLDDLDMEGKELSLRMLDAHPNIEVRLYNPFAHRGSRAVGFLTDLRRVNYRMHNKSMTADNQATIVGGRNIGNEYMGGESHADFADLDVLAVGPVVHDVSTAFDEYWNNEVVVPVAAFEAAPIGARELEDGRRRLAAFVAQAATTRYALALQQTDLLAAKSFRELHFSWGRSVLLYDAPSKAQGGKIAATTHMGPRLAEVFDQAQHDVLIVSPYFVPGGRLVDFLGDLVQRGVKVRILTNSLAANDVGVVHAGYMRYREDLLKRGVELYEYKRAADVNPQGDGKTKMWRGSDKASLHAKSFAFDRRVLFVGSFNLDPRSVLLNTEMGVLFESPELAAALSDGFDKNIDQKAYRLQLKTIPAGDGPYSFERESLEWVTRENGEEVRFEAEPDTSWWRRFSTGLVSLIVIEKML